MGLLKLGSLYKKNKNHIKKDQQDEKSIPLSPTLLPPIQLRLNLEPAVMANKAATTEQKQQEPEKKQQTIPAGSGSLFDDIFAELGSKPSSEQEVSLDTDFSLAMALSRQLELGETATTHAMMGTAKNSNEMLNKNNSSANNKPSASNEFSLFGQDSIYSSYLRGMSSFDENTSNNNKATGSMFDSLLFPNNTSSSLTPAVNNSTATPVAVAAAAAAAATAKNNSVPTITATQVVLDSDISDSNEEDGDSSDSDDDDDDGTNAITAHSTTRRTKGVRPIMERRAHDSRLMVQRKIDNWSNRTDPAESTRIETSESVIDRMKDRHRNQVKLAAIRQQQQDQQGQHTRAVTPGHGAAWRVVPPMYGAPTNDNNAFPLGMTHPVNMYNDGNMMVAPPPTPPTAVYRASILTPQPTMPVPAEFLPNPTHTTLAENKLAAATTSSSNVSKNSSNASHIQPSSPLVMMMPGQNNSNESHMSLTNTGTAAPSSISSSSTVSISKQTQEATIKEEECHHELVYSEEKQEDSTTIQLPTQPPRTDSPKPITTPTQDMAPLEDEDQAAIEADVETSDEDDQGLQQALERKRSSKKLSRQQQPGYAGSASGTAEYNKHQPIRSSRSTPNLKKKKGSKSTPTSRSSSRRNSQDLHSQPSSEHITTPPPMPTSPINYHGSSGGNNSGSSRQQQQQYDDHLYYQQQQHNYKMPRSSSHQQFNQPTQNLATAPLHNGNNKSPYIRHMSSDPNLPHYNNNSGSSSSSSSKRQQQALQQQKALHLEWERMQKQQQQLQQQYNMLQQQQQALLMPTLPTPPTCIINNNGYMMEVQQPSIPNYQPDYYQQSPQQARASMAVSYITPQQNGGYYYKR